MGEIADMMINGDLDFYTGEYIGKGKGYPRTLDNSLDWEKGYKNKKGAYGGIINFCMQKGINQSKANKIIKRYGREVLKIETPKATGLRTYRADVMPKLNKISVKIQEDFKAFKDWFLINCKNANSTH
jgi:hypothetical protein